MNAALSTSVAAVTVYVPTEVFALAVTEQSPFASVVQDEEEKVTLGPVAGARKETEMPARDTFVAVATCTARGVEKPFPTCELCPLPAETVSEAGGKLITYAALKTGESWPFKLATALIVVVPPTEIGPV